MVGVHRRQKSLQPLALLAKEGMRPVLVHLLHQPPVVSSIGPWDRRTDKRPRDRLAQCRTGPRGGFLEPRPARQPRTARPQSPARQRSQAWRTRRIARSPVTAYAQPPTPNSHAIDRSAFQPCRRGQGESSAQRAAHHSRGPARRPLAVRLLQQHADEGTEPEVVLDQLISQPAGPCVMRDRQD